MILKVFKFITCGTNILQIAFLACSQVDNIFRSTAENLRDRIRPASASASEVISFFEIIATQIAFGCALKAAPMIIRRTVLLIRLAG